MQGKIMERESFFALRDISRLARRHGARRTAKRPGETRRERG
jgi:hypothetical protein